LKKGTKQYADGCDSSNKSWGHMVDEESAEEEDQQDDEGTADETDDREIRQVTDVTEEGTSKRLRLRRWIYMTNTWRWWGGRSPTRRNRMT
jgi:hypothetical protein